ncbi:putative ribonuclease H-like domain-containing protein [Tanacetum coccineum]
MFVSADGIKSFLLAVQVAFLLIMFLSGHVNPCRPIPTQSTFTYPNPNPSASPSFTQDDTSESFIPEPTQPMPTFTQTAFSQPAFSQPNQSIFSQPAVHFQQTQPTQTNQTGQQYPNNVQSQQFQQFQTATISANNAKFPYLEKEKYEIWAMKMEYWIQNADHNLWRIVQQGNSPKRLGKDAKGNTIVHPPVSLDEHVAVQRENKVRTLLLQALPEDHMPDFHHYDDARDIWIAVKARFGGNEESKKMRKTMLKQQFTEFSVTEEEGLHKGYDRFQKILSQLNQVQARPDNDDINLKFLRALPSSWSQVALALKTRGGLESMSFDDLYNKLRSLELDVRIGHSYGVKAAAAPTHSAFIGAASSRSKSTYSDQQNIVSSVSQTSGRSDNIMECVLHSFVAENEPDQEMIYEDFDQVDQLEMEELDLKWQMAMLSLRINRFEKKAGRKMNYNNQQPARFDRRKVRCYKCLQLGHFARECNVKTVDDKARYSAFKVTEVKTDEPKALVSVDSMVNWSDHAAENKTGEVEKVYGMMAGLHADNGGDDVSDATAEFAMMGISPKVQNCPLGCDSKINDLNNMYNNLDRLYNDCYIKVQAYQNAVKTLESQKDWHKRKERMGKFKFEATLADLRKVEGVLPRICKMTSPQTLRPKPLGNQAQRPQPKTFPTCVDKKSRPCQHSVPCKSKAASVSAGSRNSPASVPAGGSDPAASRNRPAVNSAGRPNPAGWSKRPATVSAGRPVSAGWLNPAARPYIRPSSVYFNNKTNLYDPMFMYKGRWDTAGDPSTDNDIGIVDSGCSRSMTGNKEKLDDFVQIKGGIVKFGGGDGRISGKGTIRTSKLDFENVYYVEELQHFNLFSVSQICDKKNKVLFTDTDCLVLSEEFQLPDESQVVLRIPREHDLYTFHISDLQPEQKVTCLVAKASLDESTRWHRRMAHVNFKTINKLAKEGLVDGLPLKVFTNEHNCVACNKGKQHKASYKHISAVRLITETLQLLHMDLFGPTNIRSIDQKYYSLVVTDDFSSNADYAEELAKLQRARIMKLMNQLHDMGYLEPAVLFSSNGVSTGILADSSSVSADFNPVYADESTLPPGQQLGSSENTTRFPVPSDVCMDQLSSGIFTSSSYDDDFRATLTNLAPAVEKKQSSKSSSVKVLLLDILQITKRTNNTTRLQCLLLASFLLEPTSIAKALEDPDWVDAMQEEMQQFINQQVWKLVPLPAGKHAIGTKWILKNKRDARGIVVRNKARLVAQGHRQEEGKSAGLLNVKALYGLHQAPRAWYARLSAFLLQHNYRRGTIDKTLFIKKDSRDILLVQVYVDDIIFGSTNKAWCDDFEVLMKGEFEMSAMGEMTFFLGLQVKQLPDGIFISQDKYVKDMLTKFDMESVRTATTPYEAAKTKLKDETDPPVNVHLYRSMIGSLMYLTASRPDIMFAVSACSRHQVTPLTSHLNAFSLCYKSTTGGCQFLGMKVNFMTVQKQTIMATFITRPFLLPAGRMVSVGVLWFFWYLSFLLDEWFLLVLYYGSAGRMDICGVTMVRLLSFLLDALFLLIAMDYAADSVNMLVGILLLVDPFLLIGCMFLLTAGFLLLDDSFLLAEYIPAAGVVYAVITSIRAAGLISAGGIMFLLADLFLLVVTSFYCAQLNIAGWLVYATSHLVSAGSMCWSHINSAV